MISEATQEQRTTESVIKIPQPAIWLLDVTIRGLDDSPLLVHAFPEKARKQIEAKQQKLVTKARGAKDPEAEFESAKHKTVNGKDGFPAIGVKHALVRGAKHVEGVPMTDMRQSVFVQGDIIPLRFKSCEMDVATVKIGSGMKKTADVRYRPIYTGWELDLTIEFIPEVVSRDQILQALQYGGRLCGLGERRPSQNGDTYGRFEITGEVKERCL